MHQLMTSPVFARKHCVIPICTSKVCRGSVWRFSPVEMARSGVAVHGLARRDEEFRTAGRRNEILFVGDRQTDHAGRPLAARVHRHGEIKRARDVAQARLACAESKCRQLGANGAPFAHAAHKFVRRFLQIGFSRQ